MGVKRFIGIAALATGLVVAGVAGVSAPAEASGGGGNFTTLDNLNLRLCNYTNSTCPVQTVIPKGTTIWLNCYYPGSYVNGDNIWYDTTYNGYIGMVSGYYMNTGHDPNPAVSQCP